ncbi:MAG: short-chain dehydrogenase [Euryarchaeota archaeon]|nr:short-chain dehydrogenase [Euryarchaeota archaeon]DAC14194.1 MAG TPA: SDR family oxidoreductase [Candidatus Poseidoniales archaeon]
MPIMRTESDKVDKFPYSETILVGYKALVCGASKGIGRSTAMALARCGAKVVVCSRNEEELKSLVEELPGEGHDMMVMDLENLELLDEVISEKLKQEPFHILINNSAGPPGGPLIDNKIQDFEAPFKRHLHASHLLVQRCLPGMTVSGFGRIVNIISTSVKEPIPNIGLSNTLRGAMASWSKTLSRELPPCITINNILPGFTDTERLDSLADSIHQKTGKSHDEINHQWMSQVPIQRLIHPDETGIAIAFLCLPSSGGIRGVSLAVDGGRLRSI